MFIKNKYKYKKIAPPNVRLKSLTAGGVVFVLKNYLLFFFWRLFFKALFLINIVPISFNLQINKSGFNI